MTKTDRIPLDSLLSSVDREERLSTIAASLRRGAILIYPTETIYGIGGACTIKGVREKILRAKERPPENPMILIAPDFKFFAHLRRFFPPAAHALAEAFWPQGSLTLVVPSIDEPDGVGIRVCNHPFLAALFNYIDLPLYSTSANRSGDPYVNEPDRIFSLFENSVDFMIDAGALPPSPPSTVVKIDKKNAVTILRHGAISAERISGAVK
jgi:L-threonylcarbamoyladenylate synthase